MKMDIVKKIQQFIRYWLLRYSLVTEMYMVETWEKVVLHVLITITFGLFWYINYAIILTAISQFRGSTALTQHI